MLTLFYALISFYYFQVCETVKGIDAVCTGCLDKLINALSFIESCKHSNQRLITILDNLSSTLNTEIDTTNKKAMYIVCKEHETQLVFEERGVECSSCKELFYNKEDVKEHTFKEHGSHICTKCQYTSSNETAMVIHELTTHLFNCAFCSTITITEESLKEHEERSHSTQVCKDCGKSFKGMDKLLAHEEKHSVKHDCPKCGKQYTTKEFYQKHVKLCLAGQVKRHPFRSEIEKLYVCRECGKGYSTPGGLRVHEKYVHGNAQPHVCKQCGKKFTAPSYLKAHLITHTRAKNFKCEICNGKFVTKEALLYHTRRHTGEKPYPCNLCGEKFVNSSSRADHIKHKHIGPTISCDLCSRKFVTKNFLRLHKKKHYDPTNKLYIGRTTLPPNVPGEQNMRCMKTEQLVVENEYIVN